MEELIMIDDGELRGLVAGFLKRLSTKKTKVKPLSRRDMIKSAEIHIERLKKEGKLAPDAKITIITEEEPAIPSESTAKALEDVMQHPSLVDAYISYLKREDHIESFTNKFVELVIDGTELTPEEKEKGKKMLGELLSLIIRKIFSLKLDLRADMRDEHIALINKAIDYAKKKDISPREVFESDEHFKKFRRIRGVQGF
jgi:hypothetical protein